MKVIVPAAGIGKRLRPLTYSHPKPLLHVAGKPMLAHILDTVTPLNPDEVIFVVGYKGDQIKEYVESTYSFSARFVVQEELLGLGYAVKLALDHIDSEPVVILLSDTIVECDLPQFVDSGECALGLRQVDDPERFGIAEVKDGVITGLEEKPENPRTNLAVIGLYYINNADLLRKALDELVDSGKTTRGEIQLTDALEIMIKEGVKFVPFEVDGWYDAGKKETLLETNLSLLQKMNSQPDIPGSTVVPPVYIAPDATVSQCVIGPNVSVSAGSIIENSILKNTIVGSNADIRNSILNNSLVGSDVNLEGESKMVDIGVSDGTDTE